MAEEDIMHTLHKELCETLLEQMRNDPNPQLLNVIRQMLKDNNISAVAVKGSPIANVIEAFPFEDADDDNTGRHAKTKQFGN